MARVALIDIEGTVGSIDFVHRVMFPYARARLGDHVRAHARDPEVQSALGAVAAASGVGESDLDGLIGVLEGWIDTDQKIGALKTLQGRVWRSGFESGELVAHVYPDAVAALKRWSDAGHTIHVYSSGSAAAQRLYFRHTDAGDLSHLIHDYFDLAVGGKREAASYVAIARKLDVEPSSITFFSDIEAEIDAAEEADCGVVWVTRAGRPDGATRESVQSLADATP